LSHIKPGADPSGNGNALMASPTSALFSGRRLDEYREKV
jgi:hypothetical protein